MSIGNSGQSAAEVYADIIDLPHHEPKTRMRMPRSNRAASFSPFAALSGYDDAVKETARLTDKKIELSEDAQEALDLKMAAIRSQLSSHPFITIVYFVPDELKDGGAYLTHTGQIKRIDDVERTIIMVDGTKIPFDDVFDLNGDTISVNQIE